MKRIILILTLAIAIAPMARSAEQERTIEPRSPGLNRVTVDATLLSGSKPLQYSGNRLLNGLGDLRIFTTGGQEVPWILVPPDDQEQWLRARALPVAQKKKTSGFEADLGRVRRVDAIRLPTLPAPFLKRFTLEGSGDRQRWTLLVSEGTMFDLPSDSMSLRQAGFDAGEYRYLRVIWDDRSSGRMPLPDSVEVRAVSSSSTAPSLLEVAFARRESEPGTSRFRLRLPATSLPARAIILETSETTLSRRASIIESRLAGHEAIPLGLGSSTLRKIERDEAIASDLRIAIQPPEGPDLELVVDDGNNPPLQLERVFVEVPPLPSIVFEAPSDEPLTARWGDPALEAPRYDLEARRGLDLSAVPTASWGPERPATAPSTETVHEFAGSAVDRDEFRWMKPIPASPPGLTSLLVDAETQAHSHDLADVRIVTGGNRQVPYLVERREEQLEIPLEPGPRQTDEKGRSTYDVPLPWLSTPAGTKLSIRTGERLFDRNVEILTEAGGSKRTGQVLESTRWTHADAERATLPLVLQPYLKGAERFAIVIDEGDNAPLELTGVSLLIPAVRLRFVRGNQEKELELLYGAPSMRAPRYDISLLAPRLFGRTATEIEPGKAVQLRESPSPSSQRRWFWLIVAISAVVLLVVIARVLRT